MAGRNLTKLEEINDCPQLMGEIIGNNFITVDKKAREQYKLKKGAKFLYKITHIISRPEEP